MRVGQGVTTVLPPRQLTRYNREHNKTRPPLGAKSLVLAAPVAAAGVGGRFGGVWPKVRVVERKRLGVAGASEADELHRGGWSFILSVKG